MCDKVQVDAWDVANPETRVTGKSGRGYYNYFGVSEFMPNFAIRLETTTPKQNWSMFTCAEVNAAYLLVKEHNVPLDRIRIGRAMRGYLIYAPCKNCEQWLLSDGPRRYSIKPGFRGEVKNTKKAPNFNYMIDFPSL